MQTNLISVQPALHPLHCYHPQRPLQQPYAETCSKVITGEFGTILYQQIDGYYNIYRYYHCFIKQAAQVPIIEEDDRPFLCVNMKNTIGFQFDEGTQHSFYEWGSNIVYHPAKTVSALFQKEGEYSFFIIHLNLDYLDQFRESYSVLDQFLDKVDRKKAALMNHSNFPANLPMRNAVSDILFYDYADRYFYIYLVAKCQELLLPFFKQCYKDCAMVSSINEKEAEAIYRVKEKLLAQLHLPHVLEDLSQFAHLTEYKLKNGFRQIYGMGIFDFLHEVRMKKAYEMVADTLIPYDEIAIAVGYQSNTTFFNQFKKYVGISPKRLRDSIQGSGARFGIRKK